MRTLQAIVMMLCICVLANSPGHARGYDGGRSDDQAGIAAASLPGLATAGSRAESAMEVIKVAWSCPPGYVAGRYYRSCVLARRLSHPTSTPSAEQLPGEAQRHCLLAEGPDAWRRCRPGQSRQVPMSPRNPLSDRQRVRIVPQRVRFLEDVIGRGHTAVAIARDSVWEGLSPGRFSYSFILSPRRDPFAASRSP